MINFYSSEKNIMKKIFEMNNVPLQNSENILKHVRFLKRDYHGSGFFINFKIKDKINLENESTKVLEGVFVRYKGNVIGFILHLYDGLNFTLEGYKVLGHPIINNPNDLEDFKIFTKDAVH